MLSFLLGLTIFMSYVQNCQIMTEKVMLTFHNTFMANKETIQYDPILLDSCMFVAQL